MNSASKKAELTEISPLLKTSTGEFLLHEFHLALAKREWTILHAGVVLTHDDEKIFLEETRQRLPYGVALWPSSIALAQDLASRGTLAFAGKTVLELGAGTGLPGIVAASFGAHVVQTDTQELALDVCRRNGRRNRQDTIEYRQVDWTNWQDTAQYDLILGSDILYGESMHEHLRFIFAQNLAPGGAVLLADPFRAPGIRLLETLENKEGWTVYGSKWKLGEASDPRAIGVFELSRPEGKGSIQ